MAGSQSVLVLFDDVLSCSASTHTVYSTSSLVQCEYGINGPCLLQGSSLVGSNAIEPCGDDCIKGPSDREQPPEESEAQASPFPVCEVALTRPSSSQEWSPSDARYDCCEVALQYEQLRELRMKNEFALDLRINADLAQVMCR